jgi:hypothetical protein
MCDPGWRGPNAYDYQEIEYLRAVAKVINHAADTLEKRAKEAEERSWKDYCKNEHLLSELASKETKIDELEKKLKEKENDNG